MDKKTQFKLFKEAFNINTDGQYNYYIRKGYTVDLADIAIKLIKLLKNNFIPYQSFIYNRVKYSIMDIYFVEFDASNLNLVFHYRDVDTNAKQIAHFDLKNVYFLSDNQYLRLEEKLTNVINFETYQAIRNYLYHYNLIFNVAIEEDIQINEIDAIPYEKLIKDYHIESFKDYTKVLYEIESKNGVVNSIKDSEVNFIF